METIAKDNKEDHRNTETEYKTNGCYTQSTSEDKNDTETENKNGECCSTHTNSCSIEREQEQDNEDCSGTRSDENNADCCSIQTTIEHEIENACSTQVTVEQDIEDLSNTAIRIEHNKEDFAVTLTPEQTNQEEESVDRQSVPELNIDNSCTRKRTEDICKVDNEIVSTISTERLVNNSQDVTNTKKKKKIIIISSVTFPNVMKGSLYSHSSQKVEVPTKDDSNTSKRDDRLEQSSSENCNNINVDSNDTPQHKTPETSQKLIIVKKKQQYKLPNDENMKTAAISDSDSERGSPPIVELPKSEDNLRDILRMQLSSLRNVKKSSGYLTDLKKTSVSFQNLKKKRRSCDINPLIPVEEDSSKEEDEVKTINETKTILGSNENSLVSLSEDTEFMIVNVTGGVDQLKPNSELENKDKTEIAVGTSTKEETITNDVLDSVTDAQENIPVTDINKNLENPDSDVPSTSTGWQKDGPRIYKKKLFSRYDTASRCNETPLNVSVNKNISAAFVHDPGVSKSTKNSEKSPFVSDFLDDFLNESAELKVSYPIPKLGAEEGISENPKPFPFDDIVNKTPKVEQQPVPKEPKLVKAKTLAEMRRQFEKLKANEKVTENQPFENLSRYKRNKLLKQELARAYKKQKEADSVVVSTFIANTPPKNSFIMYDNKKLRVYSKNVDKCVAVIHSKSNKENIQDPPRTPPPCKQETTPTRRLSLLSSLTQNKPCPVKYKPGPLCRKVTLQNTESKSRWITELKILPKVFLEVVPQVHQPIDPKLVHLLPIFDDVVISEERVKFALSVLKPKDTNSQPEPFSFHIPYKNKQESFLVRRQCKPVICTEQSRSREANPEAEIKKVLNDIITYVEVKELGDSVIKEDDLIVEPLQQSTENSPKCKTRVKRKKLDLELLRLNCKVIDVATNESKDIHCSKPYCRMGCICKSLLCESIFSNHCQLVDCMFECKCPPLKSREVTTSNNSLSAHTVNHLEDKAKKYLAKVEREFTQTLIHTDNDAILVGTTKMRRSTKPPKKYTDFIGNDVIFDDIPSKKFSLKPKKFDLVLQKLELDDLIPYCLFHNLYNCHCKGVTIDFPENKTKEVPQIPKIRIVKTKEDQHKAWYDSCARIRKVFPEYKERNKNPVYNQKLRKTFNIGRKVFKKKETSLEENNETNITICHDPLQTATATSKPSKRKQSFIVREDNSPPLKKPDKEFALQRRKKKIKPKLNYTSFNGSGTNLDNSVPSDISITSPILEVADLPPYNPVFEGEIKLCVQNNQEMLKIIGSEKKYLRILPWEKLIKNFKSGKICIWTKEKGPTTVLCNSAGHLPPKNFTDIRSSTRRNEIVEWILTDNLPGISRDLMHLILTPKNNHFLINGYCLKKLSDGVPDVSAEEDANDQLQQQHLLINKASSSTAQSTHSEDSQFMYQFSSTPPKMLETTKTIQRIDVNKIKAKLNTPRRKYKKNLNQKPNSVPTQSILTNPLSASSSKQYRNVKAVPETSEPDATTPTLQQVLNSHKLELARTSLKRKSFTLTDEEDEDPKRIRSETSSSSTKVTSPSFPSRISKTPETNLFDDNDCGIELLELLKCTSKKYKERSLDRNEKNVREVEQDPLDITEMEMLLDKSNKRWKKVPQNEPKMVSKDPLSMSAPNSPESSDSGTNSRDPLETPKEVIKNTKRKSVGTKENKFSNNERDPLKFSTTDTMTIEKQPIKTPPLRTTLKQTMLSDPLEITTDQITINKESLNTPVLRATLKQPVVSDPLDISTADENTIQNQPLKSPPLRSTLKQTGKKTPAKSRQTLQSCLIPSRSLKCTHKDMNNVSKALVLTNKVFTKRNLSFHRDKTSEIAVPLPAVAKHLRWRMIYLNSDFTYLAFIKAEYSIKYTDLLDVVKMSSNIKTTITLRNKEFYDHYKHPLFGIFCVPDYQDRLFIGPYLPTEKHCIETLRYLQGKLIDTNSFDKMIGKKMSDKIPVWLYESSTKPISQLPNGLVIDITEDDEGSDIPVVNLDSDSSEETPNVKLRTSDNNLLCPPFVEEIGSEELGAHSVNRYIMTNIPHLGYFYACQRDSTAIDVIWPGTNKGYRFPNVTFAKNLLTQYLTQMFCPIPQDFKINVIIMTHLGVQGNKPIDAKYFSNSGLYFCGEFGIYEKSTLPQELIAEYNVESVDRLVKVHHEAQQEDGAMVRLFGLFLMSNEELRKFSEPATILDWAISEIYVLKKLCENYESEKADLENIIRMKMKEKTRGLIGKVPESNTETQLSETIEIEDSDEEGELQSTKTSPVFKKICSSGKVAIDRTNGNNKGRSILKSSLWVPKGRSVLKTNSKTGQILKGSPEKSAVVQPVKVSLNNSNVVLNKNKMLITKLK